MQDAEVQTENKVLNIEIPAIPVVIQKVLNVLENPHANANIIAANVARDPGLSAKILGVANSAFYGFSHKITSLPQAIMILGLNALKGILVTLALLEKEYSKKVKKTIVNLWQHLTRSAYIAKEVAISLNFKNKSDIITAALLHDIGKAIIALNFPEKTLEIEKLKKEKNMNSIEAEKEILGFSHEEVNFLLCEKWSLSNFIKYPLSFHHRVNQTENFVKEIAFIHFVDAIANKIEPQSEALEILGISEAKKEEIIWKVEFGR